MHDNPLLQPSLSGASEGAQAPYSTQTLFLTAFLGGPFAVLAIWAANAHRLGRLRRDMPWLFLCSLATALLCWAVFDGHGNPDHWIPAVLGSAKFATRLLALAIFLVPLALHRREQSACDLMGRERPNGLLPGIAAIVLAGAFLLLLETFAR